MPYPYNAFPMLPPAWPAGVPPYPQAPRPQLPTYTAPPPQWRPVYPSMLPAPAFPHFEPVPVLPQVPPPRAWPHGPPAVPVRAPAATWADLETAAEIHRRRLAAPVPVPTPDWQVIDHIFGPLDDWGS